MEIAKEEEKRISRIQCRARCDAWRAIFFFFSFSFFQKKKKRKSKRERYSLEAYKINNKLEGLDRKGYLVAFYSCSYEQMFYMQPPHIKSFSPPFFGTINLPYLCLYPENGSINFFPLFFSSLGKFKSSFFVLLELKKLHFKKFKKSCQY